ncbi:Zinc finger MYM-type protein 5 [Eumeta japonica]|uniref:Zinc finger MYM-type protein 5 n=1 Tax=Eumeta variegata TaxID=151549 RepID=A0A4C1ZBF9_EUMVA|nr:Zinc finger MYM-type protein 5 [Eumeta japonica]
MSSRDRDAGRKFESGRSKRKRAIKSRSSVPPSTLSSQEHESEPESTSTSMTAGMENLNPQNDPGLWPITITDVDRTEIVLRGPIRIKVELFPVNDNGRRFSEYHYNKILVNGEKLDRRWIIYSQTKDAVYCFPCRMFGLENTKSGSSEGVCDWKHLGDYLKSHESSRQHKDCMLKWIHLENGLKNCSTIDSLAQSQNKQERQHWRGEDEAHELNAEEIFKINYFYVIVDNVRASGHPRFEALKHHESIFGFMYNIKRLKEISDSELLKQCSDLQISMTVGESCDIDGHELYEELHMFIRVYEGNDDIISVLKYIIEKKLTEVYPTIEIVLRIIATTPVTDKGPRKDLPPGASQWVKPPLPLDTELGPLGIQNLGPWTHRASAFGCKSNDNDAVSGPVGPGARVRSAHTLTGKVGDRA